MKRPWSHGKALVIRLLSTANITRPSGRAHGLLDPITEHLLFLFFIYLLMRFFIYLFINLFFNVNKFLLAVVNNNFL